MLGKNTIIPELLFDNLEVISALTLGSESKVVGKRVLKASILNCRSEI